MLAAVTSKGGEMAVEGSGGSTRRKFNLYTISSPKFGIEEVFLEQGQFKLSKSS